MLGRSFSYIRQPLRGTSHGGLSTRLDNNGLEALLLEGHKGKRAGGMHKLNPAEPNKVNRE